MAENEIPKEDLYTPEEEALSAYSAFGTFFLTLGLTIVHGLRLYSDLHTKERKILDYRRSKPEVTTGYRRMAYLTYASVCFFLLLLTAEVIQFNFTPGECAKMFAVQALDKVGYFGAKSCLYLVFVLRLHQVYGQSAYGYKRRTLICIAVTIIIISVLLLIVGQIWTIMDPDYVDDTDTLFPFFCQIRPRGQYLVMIAGLMVLFDVVATIASMIAFIIPLNKVIKAANSYKDGSAQQNKRLAKMMYSGSKYKILVIVAAVSTLLWITLIFFGLIGPATFIGQLDFFINPLCLVLMTPYYPSDKYYERLCGLCILCCDRNKNSYESQASDKHEEDQGRTDNIDSTVVKSVDGSSATSAGPSIGPSVDTDVAIQTDLQVPAPVQDASAQYESADDEAP